MLNVALSWICWLFWAGLPTLTAHPVSSSLQTDLPPRVYPPREWERYWIQYTLIGLSITATAFTLVGCLCCRRHRRPKGFQDKEGKCNQEFKDGNAIGQESAFERSVEGLELNVPHMLAVTERVQFEPLPVEQIISGSKTAPKPKPSLPLSTALFERRDSDSNRVLPERCREWFDAQELCVPRERLKYLREIGHGWFGKVVEGRADLEGRERSSKNGSVVVRILTEDATTREKAWFLGEVTPYLKLRHPNVLSLLGFCLETDPYLLLFESCSVGDLKGFLLTNRDGKSREALDKENIPMRMALDIAAGLKHMHSHGFVHTDLSARNCLVASDLSAKLGDYGTGVEKYPEDYYVVGDRALPIRWSAPESVECTDTTIETREITSQANMWSYAIFLWEIVTWGDRPYHDKSDEEVIQMLLSLRTDLLSNGIRVLQSYLENCPANVCQAIRSCLTLNPEKRPNLDEVRQLLLNEHTEYLDFEQRWERLQGNAKQTRSASLQDLRGSIDSDYWTTIVDDTPRQSSFRLGEPVRNAPSVKDVVRHESGSETEEESWKGRIEKGVYTEKVKQKSKSVTDLMVLVHIDPDSDAELSLVQISSDKHGKKKLPATGSDSELRHDGHTSNEFDEALKKLRDHLPNNNSSKTKASDASEGPTLLTLTVDPQAQTPILRLSLNDKESVPGVSNTETRTVETRATETSATETSATETSATETRTDKHVLRLLSKGDDPDLPLLRYVPDDVSYFDGSKQNLNESGRDEPSTRHENNDESCFSNNFTVNFGGEGDLVDVELWNHALDSALEKKVPGFLDEGEFNVYTDFDSREGNALSELATSTPDSPRSRTQSVSDKFASEKNVDADRRCLPSETKETNDEEEEEEERKQLSTPDDEQSSDSGFRDKESCEDEENLYASAPSTSADNTAANVPISTEEEQLQILFELDTILDAEYYATLPGSDKITDGDLSSINRIETKIFSTNEDESDSIHTVDTVVESNENLPSFNVNLVESDVAKSVSDDETRDAIDVEDKIESNDLNDTNLVSERVDLIQRSAPSDVEYFNEQKESERYLGNEDEIEIEDGILNRNKLEDDNKRENSTCGEDVEDKIEDRDEDEDERELELRSKNEMRRVNEDENNISVTNSFKERIASEEGIESENKNEDESSRFEDGERYEREERNENENENEDEDSSTMSMRSDNSYVSFEIEEEFVTAIRNELLEKLPCAQMAVVEPLEAHDDDDDDDNPSVSSDVDGKQWDDDDDGEESSNRGSGGVGISIRYNVYDSPLSPIQEERESTVNSESMISNSKDESIASKESDDVLLVDTRTNKMILLEGSGENLRDDERDTTNGDLSDEENLDYDCSVVPQKSHCITIAGGGAPLPSPEEESKWQQLPSGSFPLPLPLPLEDDLMSTSFGMDRAWGSQDEDEDEEGEVEEEEDGEEEDENNSSSSSGEFVWKRYNDPDVEQVQIRSSNNEESAVDDEIDQEGEDEDDEGEEEEEEEFTPSAWNATLAPHRSALRSPDKTLKSGDDSDQKKSVWFKKQRYHCVYEYPKETLTAETRGEPTTAWEPTSYSDWEEMMDEPRLDLYSIDYDDANHTGNEEFFVSSSNRPFQFQTSDSRYVSQFFPGASTSANKDRDEVDGGGGGGDHRVVVSQNGIELLTDCGQIQQCQLGELRHTRDRLKLNLNGAPFASVRQAKGDDDEQTEPLDQENFSEISPSTDIITEDRRVLSNCSDHNTLPTVPPKDVRREEDGIDSTCSKSAQCDSQGKIIEPTDERGVSTRE